MAAQSRHITAFVVPKKGIFEFVTMPFGLKGATATFQRAISQIIITKMSPFAMAYLYDIIIATFTWEDHLKWLRIVITRILAAGFTINRKRAFSAKRKSSI